MYWRFRTPTVWREMDRLQREMNRLFSDFYPRRTRRAQSFPAMNVWANDDSTFITAELPGTKAEDIDISVVDDVLTLSGSRDPDDLEEGMNVHRRERGYGRFTRTIQLPFNVDVDQVEATFKTGVLQITLPRAEADKPKKIAVQSA